MSRRHLWLAALLAGCSVSPSYLAKDFSPPRTLAVLPFTNETNDIEAPALVRKALMQVLPRYGYHPLEASQTDTILKERFGITDGGQLGSATPQDLGRALRADGLLYGNVLSFQDLPLGFYRKRTVKVNLKILDAKAGMLLWEEEKGWTTPEVHLNAEDARKAGVLQVADRQKRRLDGTYLLEEAVLALELALKSLPHGK